MRLLGHTYEDLSLSKSPNRISASAKKCNSVSSWGTSSLSIRSSILVRYLTRQKLNQGDDGRILYMIAIKARREQSPTPPRFPKVKFSSSRQHHRPTYLKKITPLRTRSSHNLPLTYSSRPTAPPTNGTVKTKRLNT